jgi:hypothetical protein
VEMAEKAVEREKREKELLVGKKTGRGLIFY